MNAYQRRQAAAQERRRERREAKREAMLIEEIREALATEPAPEPIDVICECVPQRGENNVHIAKARI